MGDDCDRVERSLGGPLVGDPIRDFARSAPLWPLAIRMAWATMGRPMAARWVAMAGALAVPCAVIFGANALRPADVRAWFESSAAFRAALLAASVVLGAPIVGSAAVAPGTTFARSLPVGRGPWVSFVAVSGALAQFPAFLLFAANAPLEGCLFAFAAGAASLAIAAALVEAGVAAFVGLAVVVAGAPISVALPLVVVGLALVSRIVWIAAPGRGVRTGRANPLVSGPPWQAIAAVHGLRLLREQRTLIVRAGAILLGAVAIATLVGRHYDHDESASRSTVSLVCEALAIVAAVSGACESVLDGERRLRWMLDATGTRAAQSHGAAALTLGGLGGAMGGALGACVPALGHWRQPGVARGLVVGAAWGVALAFGLLACGRWLLDGRPNERARFVQAAVGLLLAAIAAALVFGEGAAYGGLAVSATVLAELALRPQRAWERR